MENFDDALDKAILLAEEAVTEFEKSLSSINKRNHLNPSRRTRRNEINFIQQVFDNEEDLPQNSHFRKKYPLNFVEEPNL